MQRCLHRYRNMSRLFSQIESLFACISDNEGEFDDELILDTSFKDMVEIFLDNILWFREPKMFPFEFEDMSWESKPKDIVVCISGGKDSAAVAKLLKNQEYNVHLYHMRGVNGTYFDEVNAVKKIAEYLDLDLAIEDVRIVGKHPFVEHPMKNMLILNGAIHYAKMNGYLPTIAFGTFSQSVLETSPFDVCAGDCRDMMDAYEKVIQRIIPGFMVLTPLRFNGETFDILAKDWKLFDLTLSCMSPQRFREYWRHSMEQKYNIRLFSNDCGGKCWKDCIQDLWLVDFNYQDYGWEYYKHCLEILGYTIAKEMGEKIADIDIVWRNYMWYPMTDSKYYDKLKDAEFEYDGLFARLKENNNGTV